MKLPFVISQCLLLSILTSGCGGGSSSGQTAPTPPTPQAPTEPPATSVTLRFSDVTQPANLSLRHGFSHTQDSTMPMMYSGGTAVGDYDNDGDLDVYFIAGSNGNNQLYQNQNDGTFIELASEAGVAISGVKGTGPAFADIDGDGWIDLFVGAVDSESVYLFRNNQDGTFEDVTLSSGLNLTAPNSVSATFGDVDLDGDLDLLISHWGNPLEEGKSLEILWRNDSDADGIQFSDISTDWGISEAYADQISEITEQNQVIDTSFVPSLSDIDKDGDLDLLLVSDFGQSKVLENIDASRFENVTSSVINDQFGMGSSVADVDNDGDMDWYVTSIHEKPTSSQTKNPSQGYTGNRLYVNDGAGNFSNRAQALDIADGGWAWASCFADFNNDGLVDIFHVNGWGQDGLDFAHYFDDRSRLYIQSDDGNFEELAWELGIQDTRQGRGIACNDIDDDGDVDILVSNNQDAIQLYRNELSQGHHYLKIRLKGKAPNTQALGTFIEVTSPSGLVQTQEVRINNNFTSTNAVEAHFGLGTDASQVNIKITWPDKTESQFNGINVDSLHTLEQL